MSQIGYLVWYTEDPNVDPVHLLQELPALVGFERADYVTRTDPIVEDPDDATLPERLASKVLASELHRLYVPTASMSVFASKAELGDRVEACVAEVVPAEVRDRFMPNCPYFKIGRHYLADATLDEPVFAHPTVSVGCWGNSSPKNWKRMKELTFAAEGIVAERLRFEHLIGPLQTAMFWFF